jgi:hypothetical protein
MDIPSFSRNPFGVGLPYVRPPKRKVFISYHHKNDQGWYDSFSKYCSDTLDLFYDNSLERKVDSDDSEYLNRKIREEYIFGTSVTIVLCGSETGKRRWVDWEIYATLFYKHGLIGIALPTCSRSYDQKYIVPTRLHNNIESGYALWMTWTENVAILAKNIEEGVSRSSQASLVRNSDPKMQRSYS